MGAFIGILATIFRWAGAFRGVWAFIVPFWGFMKGRFGRGANIPSPSR